MAESVNAFLFSILAAWCLFTKPQVARKATHRVCPLYLPVRARVANGAGSARARPRAARRDWRALGRTETRDVR
jgi:hypothetical protein